MKRFRSDIMQKILLLIWTVGNLVVFAWLGKWYVGVVPFSTSMRTISLHYLLWVSRVRLSFVPIEPAAHKYFDTDENTCCHGTGLETLLCFQSFEGTERIVQGMNQGSALYLSLAHLLYQIPLN